MKLGVMQPYFLPYIGYYQLISSVDLFIVYDNIKYTKKGWINRNRMLQNGVDVTFTLPLRRDSDSLDIEQRQLSPDFRRVKLLNQLSGAYRKAPYFSQTYPMLESIILFKENNLFRYLFNSLLVVCAHIKIQTEICLSSEINIDHNLAGKDRVLAICEATGASTYINAIGGVDLYSREDFINRGVRLAFIKSKVFEYPQFGQTFVPWLSIVDVLMFNSVSVVNNCVTHDYDLI